MSIHLRDPVEIAPNLEPGVRIGSASWVTISYSQRPGREGRVRYRWTIIRDGLRDETHDDIQSGCQGGNLRDGLSSLLTFLGAFAEANRPHYGERVDRENCDLFPECLADWACLHASEIKMAAAAIEENPDCMREEP